MIKTILHFDSIDGIQNYDTILKKYHCYNTTIKINNPLKNIKEISLKMNRNKGNGEKIRDTFTSYQ